MRDSDLSILFKIIYCYINHKWFNHIPKVLVRVCYKDPDNGRLVEICGGCGFRKKL